MLRLLKTDAWFWLAGLAFVSINALLVANHVWIGWGLPVLLVLLLALVFSFDKLLWLTVFFTPLSVRVENVFAGVGIDLPSDLLISLLSVSVFFKFLFDERFDKRVLLHPISIAIYLHLAWLLFTSLTSSMPLVSLKFFISRSWFVLLFFFVASQAFANVGNIHRFMWLYLVPLVWVVAYTLHNHDAYNFDQRASYGMSQPFFVNHGIYAAALAMFIPYLWLLVFNGNKMGYNPVFRVLIVAVLLFFMVGMVYSYTRAAWISLAAALVVGGALYMRLSPLTYVAAGLVAAGSFFSVKDRLALALQRNQQVSADSFDKHVKSIYNIKNDDSNLERINRWKCALRMTADRPVLGFGPGTYVFQYSPYQRAKEITKISTNVGSLGNCHSEFLQPLAETGIPGLMLWLWLVGISLYTGIKISRKAASSEVKLLSLATMLGLVTYYTHGLLNNYSDLDKAAVLIWGFTGMLVALDVYFSCKAPATSETDTLPVHSAI